MGYMEKSAAGSKRTHSDIKDENQEKPQEGDEDHEAKGLRLHSDAVKKQKLADEAYDAWWSYVGT